MGESTDEILAKAGSGCFFASCEAEPAPPHRSIRMSSVSADCVGEAVRAASHLDRDKLLLHANKEAQHVAAGCYNRRSFVSEHAHQNCCHISQAMVVLLAHSHVCQGRGCTMVGHMRAQVAFSAGLQTRSLVHEYRRIWAQVSHLAQDKNQEPFEGLHA